MTPREELETLRKEKRLAELEAKSAGPPPKEDRRKRQIPWPHLIDVGSYGAVDEVVDSATFGGANRFKAGVNMFRDDVINTFSGDDNEPRPYGEYYKDVMAEKKAYQKESPYAAGASSITGAMINPLMMKGGRWATGQTPAKVPMAHNPRYVDEGIGLLNKTGRGALYGGTSGFAYGAGQSEEIDPMAAIGEGAKRVPANATIGGAIPTVFKGLQLVWRSGENMLRYMTGGNNQKTKAMRKVVEALRADHPEKTLDEIGTMVEELGPEGALMDAGPNSRGLLFTVFAKPGETKAQVVKRLTQRQEGIRNADEVLEGGQIRRIKDGIDEIHPEQYKGAQNQSEITKLYKKAYADDQDVVIKSLDRLRATPHGRAAWDSARTQMQNDMELMAKPDAELTALFAEQGGQATGHGVAGAGVKLKAIDWFKRGYDDIIEKLKRGVETGRNSKGELTSAIRQRKMLIRQTDAATKTNAWKRGRGLSSTNFEVADASALGGKFMNQNMKNADIQKAMEGMGPEALHEFRVAVAQAIKAKMGGLVVRADATKKVFEIPDLEDKMLTAFGSKQRFAKYIRLLKAEKEMNKTYNVMGGSQTAEREAGKAAAEIDPSRIAQGFGDIARGGSGYVRGPYNIALGLKDKFLNSEGTTKEMGKLLLGRDVNIMKDTYTRQAFNDRLGKRLLAALQQGATSRNYTGE